MGMVRTGPPGPMVGHSASCAGTGCLRHQDVGKIQHGQNSPNDTTGLVSWSHEETPGALVTGSPQTQQVPLGKPLCFLLGCMEHRL